MGVERTIDNQSQVSQTPYYGYELCNVIAGPDSPKPQHTRERDELLDRRADLCYTRTSRGLV